MKAKPLFRSRQNVEPKGFVEITVWEVPTPVRASQHHYKYALAFVVDDVCVLRYDNEAGKGDHKHIGEREMPYTFTDVEKLFDDFWTDVDQWSE